MKYIWKYKKQNIDITMISDGEYLTGLCFSQVNGKLKKLDIFKETTRWLDIYFSGKNPNFIPKYKIENLTPFKKEVINILLKIPYGKTTYKDIATKINMKTPPFQAVGKVLSSNSILIIIPCHRVIGSNGSLTGYKGGLDKKIFLLKHEKVKNLQ